MTLDRLRWWCIVFSWLAIGTCSAAIVLGVVQVAHGIHVLTSAAMTVWCAVLLVLNVLRVLRLRRLLS